ncbi:hypothetical protein LTR36_005889 [Oleoguttula mirabilis]|uniref:NmrA-like domain-containing protein n=1 Tax=Oleoguttula mirabilis TaxID=1507867 RepID=A0AAV9JEC5_9PEZI|nr:hypothetical protein LTR36_005889 [Oleoguttula mirabilis]
MATARRLVVTGATGKQGGALISALLSKPSQPFEIYALTRNKTSKGAQALARKPNVHVIEGDFKDPGAIFKQVENPWGFFSVTMPMSAVKEEKDGKAMTSAAIEAGVEHIVFTATERGGQTKSDTEPTNVPHFISKFNIEKDIVVRAAQSKQGTTWTFLRPVAFMENLSNDFLGKGFVAMWRLNGDDRKLQLIGTKDIGKVAAEAFLNADTDEYRNKAISLAGDEISPREAATMFKEVTGQEIPSTYSFVGSMLRWMLWQHLGIMFNWFASNGFGADVKALRQRYPFLQDFKTWVAEESAWKKQ